MNLTINLLKDQYSICKINPNKEIPPWSVKGDFYSISRSEEELSIVCAQSLIPTNNIDEIICDKNWSLLKIEGILDFSLVGILSKISTILATNKISIFAISTYNTDYILVKSSQIDTAIGCLENSGYKIIIS
ncbi:MAG: ACT domain-containing protein [Clostridium sp.]|uniref:ACT domain-containing protein n=1 Tax=Clostridium sp. TaxID=1506 RepID=UPI002FC8ADAB